MVAVCLSSSLSKLREAMLFLRRDEAGFCDSLGDLLCSAEMLACLSWLFWIFSAINFCRHALSWRRNVSFVHHIEECLEVMNTLHLFTSLWSPESLMIRLYSWYNVWNKNILKKMVCNLIHEWARTRRQSIYEMQKRWKKLTEQRNTELGSKMCKKINRTQNNYEISLNFESPVTHCQGGQTVTIQILQIHNVSSACLWN